MNLTPFGQALQFVLQWEGGYVNHAADPGGATNYGVTQSTYDDHREECGLPKRSVKGITRAEVQNIYTQHYWKAAGCDTLPLPLAIAVFDTAVNFGVGRAKSFLAKARAAYPGSPFGLKAAAMNVVSQRIAYRHARVAEKPSQVVFLKGWLNRDNALGALIGKVA